jgi:hypothetical protein
MMRTVMSIAHFALLTATVLAQSEGASPADTPAPAANPTFVIADVHPSSHSAMRGGGFPMISGGRYM